MNFYFRVTSFFRGVHYRMWHPPRHQGELAESTQDDPDNIVFLDVWRKL